jgi:hypothetical protein
MRDMYAIWIIMNRHAVGGTDWRVRDARVSFHSRYRGGFGSATLHLLTGRDEPLFNVTRREAPHFSTFYHA